MVVNDSLRLRRGRTSRAIASRLRLRERRLTFCGRWVLTPAARTCIARAEQAHWRLVTRGRRALATSLADGRIIVIALTCASGSLVPSPARATTRSSARGRATGASLSVGLTVSAFEREPSVSPRQHTELADQSSRGGDATPVQPRKRRGEGVGRSVRPDVERVEERAEAGRRLQQRRRTAASLTAHRTPATQTRSPRRLLFLFPPMGVPGSGQDS